MRAGVSRTLTATTSRATLASIRRRAVAEYWNSRNAAHSALARAGEACARDPSGSRGARRRDVFEEIGGERRSRRRGAAEGEARPKPRMPLRRTPSVIPLGGLGEVGKNRTVYEMGTS